MFFKVIRMKGERRRKKERRGKGQRNSAWWVEKKREKERSKGEKTEYEDHGVL